MSTGLYARLTVKWIKIRNIYEMRRCIKFTILYIVYLRNNKIRVYYYILFFCSWLFPNFSIINNTILDNILYDITK